MNSHVRNLLRQSLFRKTTHEFIPLYQDSYGVCAICGEYPDSPFHEEP